MKKFSRRTFVSRATKSSAAILALISGLIPEISGADMPTPASDPSDSPPTPLDPAIQTAFYSQALNDADVMLLMSTLPEQGRLDPPSASFSIASTVTGQATQQVFLPVRSYSSGITLAYVIYGSGSTVIPDAALQSGMVGPLQPGAVKAMVSNSGLFQFAAGGILYPSPSADLSAALFIYLFPDEYVTQQTGGSVIPTSSWSGREGALKNKPAFRKVMQAGTGPLADCLSKARYDFSACIQKVQAVLGAIIIGILLIAACIGVLMFTQPAGATFAYTCLGVSVATLAIIQKARWMADNCGLAYNDAVLTCNENFPPLKAA